MKRRIAMGAAILSLALTQPAYAYIDPGTGAIIIQAILGSIAAAMVFLRGLRQRVLEFLRIKPREAERKPDAEGHKSSE